MNKGSGGISSIDLEDYGGMEDTLEREIMALAELKVFEMRSSRVGVNTKGLK